MTREVVVVALGCMKQINVSAAKEWKKELTTSAVLVQEETIQLVEYTHARPAGL